MATFTVKAAIRWSDIDPNFHVLHSRYYDYCTNARIQVLAENGITMQAIQSEKVGLILFREECVFKKELNFGDEIEIRIKLLKATRYACSSCNCGWGMDGYHEKKTGHPA
jgi:acyl-CoA thioester hydrolase